MTVADGSRGDGGPSCSGIAGVTLPPILGSILMLVNIDGSRYHGSVTEHPPGGSRSTGAARATSITSSAPSGVVVPAARGGRSASLATPAAAGPDPDVRLLAALADPIRLAIVRQLADRGAVCACDFDACRLVSQPTVSHHLRVLREAGVVRAERRGTWVYYSLVQAALDRLAAIVRSVQPPPAVAPGSPGVASTESAIGRRLPVVEAPVDAAG